MLLKLAVPYSHRIWKICYLFKGQCKTDNFKRIIIAKSTCDIHFVTIQLSKIILRYNYWLKLTFNMHWNITFPKSSFYLTDYIKCQQFTFPVKQMLIGRKVGVYTTSVSKCSTGTFLYIYGLRSRFVTILALLIR